jgi:hypothetical protein
MKCETFPIIKNKHETEWKRDSKWSGDEIYSKEKGSKLFSAFPSFKTMKMRIICESIKKCEG